MILFLVSSGEKMTDSGEINMIVCIQAERSVISSADRHVISSANRQTIRGTKTLIGSNHRGREDLHDPQPSEADKVPATSGITLHSFQTGRVGDIPSGQLTCDFVTKGLTICQNRKLVMSDIDSPYGRHLRDTHRTGSPANSESSNYILVWNCLNQGCPR